MNTENTRPHILLSCYAHKSREGESFVPDHVFSFQLSGSMEIFAGGKTHMHKDGDFLFFRRNELVKFVKHPPANGEFVSVAVTMDQDTLQRMATEQGIKTMRPYAGSGNIPLKANNLFKNYIASLMPYLNGAGQLSKTLTNLKVREAVMILLETNPELRDVLFDFSEPGKIELEAYMNEHYKFNVDVSRFAYLTGRSLATFKRDFEKIFHTSPARWLLQQRLSDAYYLIKEKGRRPTDVYLEVGFKDLSHFSFAFKKTYGIAPSML